jgi:hypothetical protein
VRERRPSRPTGGAAAGQDVLQCRRLGSQDLGRVAGHGCHAGSLPGVRGVVPEHVPIVLYLHATARGRHKDGLDLPDAMSGHQASMLRRASSRPPS